jgi:hypothetical protein
MLKIPFSEVAKVQPGAARGPTRPHATMHGKQAVHRPGYAGFQALTGHFEDPPSPVVVFHNRPEGNFRIGLLFGSVK